MHIHHAVVAAIALVLASDLSHAGECASLATQDEKISCLERSIEELERKLDAERNDIERLVNEKVRKALEPRVWEVAPQ